MTRGERLGLASWWALSVLLAAGAAAAGALRWHVVREHRAAASSGEPAALARAWLAERDLSAAEKAAVASLGVRFEEKSRAAHAAAESAREEIGSALASGKPAPSAALERLAAAQNDGRAALVEYCFAVRDALAEPHRKPFAEWSHDTLLR